MYHETASHYADKLNLIRNEIVEQVNHIIKDILGGNICVSYYHSEVGLDRYTFFETDGDGYGRELFIESITTNPEGEVEFCLSDSEDCYNPTWDISNFTATESLYLLYELEAIVGYVEESGEKVVTDYPDYAD